MKQNETQNTKAKTTKTLLILGAIAGPLFTLLWFIEGMTRKGYNPLRIPISSLSIGDMGWTQMVNFFASGILTVILAIGLWRAAKSRGGSTWGPLLIGLAGLGLIGAGFFVTDPMNGYPAGTPALPPKISTAGLMHNLLSTLVFTGIPAACFVFTRRFFGWREREWAVYSLATGIAFIILFVMTSLGFQTAGLVDFAGLFQRLTLVTGMTWLTLLSIHLMQAPEELQLHS
jgi:hypothetical protein